MEEQNTFNYLIKLAGKILFVIGFVVNVLLLLFGFWPSLLYILVMLVGVGMFSFPKNTDGSVRNVRAWLQIISNNLKLPVINSNTVFAMARTALFTLVGIIAGAIIFFYLSQDYFKKRDTQNDCKEIVSSLNDFFKQKKEYPGNLLQVIGSNPLRQNWSEDYWGHAYSYTTTEGNKSFTLISPGEDGKLNTKDDLVFNNH